MAKSAGALKPGDITPHSGKYEEVGPLGGDTGDSCVSVQGRPLPPTNKPGNGWILVDPSGDK
jgi:hypothetical protein